jgi:cytochrome c oxidase assembly factor CtaG
LCAWLLHAAALWLWHIPRLFNAALGDAPFDTGFRMLGSLTPLKDLQLGGLIMWVPVHWYTSEQRWRCWPAG